MYIIIFLIVCIFLLVLYVLVIFCNLCSFPKQIFTEKKKNLLLFSVFLILMSADFYFSGLMRGGAPLWVLINRESQPFSLLALPLLALYNGKRGKWRLKYFFYVFYPAHLGLIYLIGVLTGLA